ncbi:hypothetical protein K490DRAFT_65174 [Saccharata proteae CBS 121410]|uniref:Uncharacterized protein n=1 Tax=Saccharata proteae CBS 121410 TaxID=1314787 RepID=A0A9P4HTS8_9PEZI|nr:hypothetical protein K490DRAFT_65174 [Saccharata proteae CBS 121410]
MSSAGLSKTSQHFAFSGPLIEQKGTSNTAAVSTSYDNQGHVGIQSQFGPKLPEPSPPAWLLGSKPEQNSFRRVGSTSKLDQVEDISKYKDMEESDVSMADDEGSDGRLGFKCKRSRRNAFSLVPQTNKPAPDTNTQTSRPKRQPLRRSYRLKGFVRDSDDSDDSDEETLDYLKSITVPAPTKQSEIFKGLPDIEVKQNSSVPGAGDNDGKDDDWLHPDSPVLTVTRPSEEQNGAESVEGCNTKSAKTRKLDKTHLMPPPRMDTRKRRDAAGYVAKEKRRAFRYHASRSRSP